VGKENGVDEFGFAAREFGHERYHDLVIAHQRGQALQALVHRRIEQVLRAQPVAQRQQVARKGAAPAAQPAELFAK